MAPIQKALCIVRLLVARCNSMSPTRVLRPAALAKGFRFVGDRATRRPWSGSRATTSTIWDCTRCYFCNERCPKVLTRATPSPSSAPSPSGSASTGTWARSTPSGSSTRRRRPAASGDRARPEDPGRRLGLKEVKFALKPLQARQGAAIPHVADEVQEARALYEVSRHGQAATARPASSRPSARAARPPRRSAGRGEEGP